MRVWARRWVLACRNGGVGTGRIRIGRWFDARASPHLCARSSVAPGGNGRAAPRSACAQTIEVDRAGEKHRRGRVSGGWTARGRAGASCALHGERLLVKLVDKWLDIVPESDTPTMWTYLRSSLTVDLQGWIANHTGRKLCPSCLCTIMPGRRHEDCEERLHREASAA